MDEGDLESLEVDKARSEMVNALRKQVEGKIFRTRDRAGNYGAKIAAQLTVYGYRRLFVRDPESEQYEKRDLVERVV